MYDKYQQRLSQLITHDNGRSIHGGQKGIEKESLRTTPNGHLAQTPHPPALGSAFAHPHITTDYSESLLELVTAPHKDIRDALQELDDIHAFVYAHIDGELLWNTSMPCIVHGEATIPIGRYGSSNAAKMKEVYRLGLGHRYGRVMQAIAGVHFNYSLPEDFWPTFQALEQDSNDLTAFRSERYLGLIRNYLRHDWLTLYLFGASPAICNSFFKDMQETRFQHFDEHTVYEPHGTTLRMSDIGYQNKPGLGISLNNLDEYIQTLNRAVNTSYPPFEEIGLKDEQGEYQQINTHLLQIANEYYNAIRPKQPMKAGERPTTALTNRGIGYVEVRSLDINPLDPVGVNENQLRFMEMMLILCALSDSPPLTPAEEGRIRHNQQQTALLGRQPNLTLKNSATGEIPLQRWAEQIMTALQPLAQALDNHETGTPYQQSLAIQAAKVSDPGRTPSAQMLADMKQQQKSFYGYTMAQAKTWQADYTQRPLDPTTTNHFTTLAQQSHAKQKEAEANDTQSFTDYLKSYFAS